MNSLLQAEHHTAALVHAAVIVLIHRAVAGVRIVGHAVLIEAGVNGFVIAEQRVLALPRPDGGRHLAQTVARLAVDAVVHLAGNGIRRVVLDQRAQRVHDGDAVTAGRLDIIVADDNVLMPVCCKGLFVQRRALKLCMRVGIAHGDAPAADMRDIAALDQNIPEARRAGGGLVLRAQGGHIDTAVVHVFIVHIAVYIMHLQVLQRDAAADALIPGNHSHAGALHLVGLRVTLPDHSLGAVGDLQIAHRDIGGIIQQHGGGNIAVIHMGGRVQRTPIVLIPDALSVGGDAGGTAFTISADGDGAALGAAALQLQKLLFKAAAAPQQDGVARCQRKAVYRKQRGKGTILMQAVILVLAGQRVHIICLAQGPRTPPPAYAFQ